MEVSSQIPGGVNFLVLIFQTQNKSKGTETETEEESMKKDEACN